MGRWVTSKGRKIYIPDEGEENPYKKYENLPRHQKTAGEEWERQVANAHRDYKIAERSDNNLAAWREQLEYGNGPKMARDKIALEAIKREQEKRSAAAPSTQINKDEDKKEKQIAVNGKGTKSPKDLQSMEKRRDELWDKEDHKKLTPAEKKELDSLQSEIDKHYDTKKKQTKTQKQIEKDNDIKEKQIAANKEKADKLNGKKALNPKQQKAAELAKKQLSFNKGYAEITGNHWNMVGMSNEKMVAALNANDSNYTYEYKTEETKGAFGMPNAKVTHHRIYRKKK